MKSLRIVHGGGRVGAHGKRRFSRLGRDRLIVELDGAQHEASAIPDRHRTGDLKRIGFDVIRFSNEEVFPRQHRTRLCHVAASLWSDSPGDVILAPVGKDTGAHM